MAVPASNQPPSRSVQGYYTVGTGYTVQNTATSLTTANVPTDNATVLIGIDVVSYRVGPTGSIDLTFPNLPVRNNKTNPVQPFLTTQKPFSVLQGDTLLFVTFPQGTAQPVDTQPYGVVSNVNRYPGPFLGSNTYTGFSVTVTGTSGTTGQVIGMLFLQRGTS